MDYEKLYKETINKLRKLHDDWESTQNRAAKELELVLPELCESEDERIREGLIEHLKELKEQSVEGSHLKRPEHYDTWIAWLEKCGEQKPSWSEEDEIHLKNAILSAEKEWGVNSFTAKWLKSIKDRVQPQPTSEWSEDDEKFLNYAISLTDDMQIKNFLKSLKDRVQPQLKQEWSEANIDYSSEIIGFLNNYIKTYGYTAMNSWVNWLKSIKDRVSQPYWKPSEEQIGALDYAYCELFKRGENGEGSNCVHPLMTLIDDLKKL